MSSPLTPIPSPTWAWLVKELNLRCSVERLPADTHFQIKSFTVESKEFSLSLHKHESNGGGGLQLDVSQFWHPRKVAAHLTVCAVKFKCHFKPSKITCVFNPSHEATFVYYFFFISLNREWDQISWGKAVVEKIILFSSNVAFIMLNDIERRDFYLVLFFWECLKAENIFSSSVKVLRNKRVSAKMKSQDVENIAYLLVTSSDKVSSIINLLQVSHSFSLLQKPDTVLLTTHREAMTLHCTAPVLSSFPANLSCWMKTKGNEHTSILWE